MFRSMLYPSTLSPPFPRLQWFFVSGTPRHFPWRRRVIRRHWRSAPDLTKEFAGRCRSTNVDKRELRRRNPTTIRDPISAMEIVSRWPATIFLLALSLRWSNNQKRIEISRRRCPGHVDRWVLQEFFWRRLFRWWRRLAGVLLATAGIDV